MHVNVTAKGKKPGKARPRTKTGRFRKSRVPAWLRDGSLLGWHCLLLTGEMLTGPLWKRPSFRRIELWATMIGARKQQPLYCTQCGIDLWSNPGARWQTEPNVFFQVGTYGTGLTSHTDRGIVFYCDCHPLVAAEVPWRALKAGARQEWRWWLAKAGLRFRRDPFVLTLVGLPTCSLLGDVAFPGAGEAYVSLCTTAGWTLYFLTLRWRWLVPVQLVYVTGLTAALLMGTVIRHIILPLLGAV